MRDLFVSYAAEDKESAAQPLVYALMSASLSVWFDEFELLVGDGLRRTIDRGLKSSRYGVVILSPHFFAKQWPQRELDGLVTLEVDGSSTILPVWHNIRHEDVRRYSPTLADKIGLPTSLGIEKVGALIVQRIQRDRLAGRQPENSAKPVPTEVRVDKRLSPNGSFASIRLRLRVEHTIVVEQRPAFLSGLDGLVTMDGRIIAKERIRPMLLPRHETFPFMIEDVGGEVCVRGAAGVCFVHVSVGGTEIAKIF
jgi:hypothetical protein